MKIFTVIGSFLGENLLAVLLWLIFANALAFVLCGEDENRVAHGKNRYPFAIFLVIALLGGALGALVGHVIFHQRNKQFLRGLLYTLLMLLQLAAAVLCIVYAEKTPTVYFTGMWSSLGVVSHFQSKLFGRYIKVIMWWFIVADLAAFFMYMIDKICAVKKKRRIPEVWLLAVTALGGGLGALLGMLIFRHKVRHAKFYITVPALLLLQIVFAFCVKFG